MKIKVIEPADLDVYLTWFPQRGWGGAPAKELLSDTGLVVSDNKGPLCIGFLYVTNSRMTLLEWVATNPERHAVSTVKAIKALIDYCKQWISQQDGVRFLIGATDNEGLKTHYEKYMKATASKPCYVMAWKKE